MGDGDYNYNGNVDVSEVVSIKRYVCFYLLNMIPIVGLVWCIIKACDTYENKSYRNLCKSYLIMMVVGVAMVVAIWILAILFVAFAAAALY